MRAAQGTERLPLAGLRLVPIIGALVALGATAALLLEWDQGLLDSWHGFAGAGGVICTLVCCMLVVWTCMRAKEALRLAETQANEVRRQLLDVERIGQIGHWISRKATGTIVWSPQIFEIAGIPLVPAMSAPEAQAPIHPDDLPAFSAVIKDAVRTGQTRSCEHRWVRPNGDIRWVHIDVSPRYDAAGNWSELLGTVRDITERKIAEDSLKHVQQQLIDAIEAIPEGFVLWDEDDCFVLANENFRRLWPSLDDILIPGTSFEMVSRIAAERGVIDIGSEGIEEYVNRTADWHQACGEPSERRLGDGRWLHIAERRTRDGGIVGIRADITERKQTEEALTAAREQLEEAIEAISEGFVLFDRDDRYVLTNSKYREMYPTMLDMFAPGTRYEDMLWAGLRRNLWVVEGDPEEWIRRIIAWHRATNEPQERQLGDGRWMRLAERRTRDGGIVGIRTDITERKQAEEELKAARQQLVDAIEAISEGFVLFDKDDRYVLTNSKYRDRYPHLVQYFEPGTSYETMLRAAVASGIHDVGGDPEGWIQRNMAWHRACGAAMERELQDGTWVRLIERRTSDGGIVGLRTDITERKQAEEELKAARQQLIDAIESISEGFVLFDRDDRYVLTNSNYRRLFPGVADLFVPGTPFEAVVRANVDRNLHLFGPEGADAWAQKTREWHSACDQPIEIELADGHWVRAIERRTSDGGIVGIRTDITALKQSEAALHHRVADLEEARARLELQGRELTSMAADLAAARDAAEAGSRAKSDFLANMSHEIRTPMNGILGMNALLLQSDLSAEQRQCAVAVRDSANALLSLINDILDISKLEAGKVELETIDFNLVEVVEASVALLAPTARDKGIDLRVSIEPQAQSVYRGDPVRLRQILLNLVGNAIKFTERGSVSVRVVARAVTHRGVVRLRFEIADTGIGMSAEASVALFQKFHQADTSITRRFGGTGLGLAISKQLVEMMSGRIGVRSKLGRGSTFRFDVPMRRAVGPDAMRHGAAPETGARGQFSATRGSKQTQQASRPLRVLVAEDNTINQQLAAMLLKKAGHLVDIAENGAEAVTAVQDAEYDVVLMDVQMPVLDGIEAADRIRKLPPPKNAVPIVAVTAHAMAGARERYLAAGMDGYLSKPIDLTALLRVFDEIGQDTRGGQVKDTSRDIKDVPGEESANIDLDEENLTVLAEHLSAGRIHELLMLFLAQLDEQMPRITALAAASDWAALKREVHTLVGAAGNIGATRIYHITRTVEAACGEPRTKAINELIRQLVKARKSTAKAIRGWSASRVSDIQQSAA